MAGVRFGPGERVLCALNSGNRDEAVFDDAETFNPDRPRRPHLAFGSGIHACLGQNLARADLRIFLNEILRRMPDFQIDLERTKAYSSVPLVNGYSAMPMRFTPAPAGQGCRRLAGPDRAEAEASPKARRNKMNPQTEKSADWIELRQLAALPPRALDTKDMRLARCFVDPIHVTYDVSTVGVSKDQLTFHTIDALVAELLAHPRAAASDHAPQHQPELRDRH